MVVWKNDSDTIILKPIEIRSKRGVKKMKKTNSAIYIPNMDAKEFDKICAEKGLQFIYTPVPPHGRLVDADALMKEFEKAQRTMEQHGQEYSCSFLSSSQEISTEWYCVEDMVENAPTIIEAEEGE